MIIYKKNKETNNDNYDNKLKNNDLNAIYENDLNRDNKEKKKNLYFLKMNIQNIYLIK